MKLNRLETHDRLQHFIKDQSEIMAKGIQDCLKVNPLSLAIQDRSPYIYIFGHPRTADDGVNKRMLWQPRLTKPQAQTNSYLFRAQSKTDLLQICWCLPPEEMWSQYQKGNVTEHEIVNWSIDQFLSNKPGLEKPEPDDLNDNVIDMIYKVIKAEMRQDDMIDKIYSKSKAPFDWERIS